MPDQANPLRQLMLASAQPGPSPGLRPRLVVVAGGRSGVGTTTMALNLAVAMAQRGTRAALIDADSSSGDVAMLCRLDDAHSLADVLAGRATVAEALQPGPGGILV
ncbi:MAG: P-loop NTPase, partial [Patescibacteria group bacterium]|nr:P-loop NTPase [Patescibacteria group bacterium]